MLGAPTTEPAATRPNGRFDHGLRRRAKRSGAEKGCWVYLPVEVLDVAGYGADSAPPFYRVWGSPRGGIRIRLYRER